MQISLSAWMRLIGTEFRPIMEILCFCPLSYSVFLCLLQSVKVFTGELLQIVGDIKTWKTCGGEPDVEIDRRNRLIKQLSHS